MVTTYFQEGTHALEFLVSEANGYRSRDVAVLASAAADLVPGTVLGRITATGKMVILAPAAADGSQNAAAILYNKAEVTQGDQQKTVFVRDCEVNGLHLTWPVGITVLQQNTAISNLAALGILVRT